MATLTRNPWLPDRPDGGGVFGRPRRRRRRLVMTNGGKVKKEER